MDKGCKGREDIITMANKRHYRLIADFYDILDLPFEYFRYRKIRPEMFDGGKGRILDVGVGTGCNIAFYPQGADVTGIDISPRMLERARRRRLKLNSHAGLVEMDATNMAFADDSFDLIVTSFMLCVMDADLQVAALKEIGRVCAPDGEIRILEYTISTNPLRRLSMAVWAPLAHMLYGAVFNHDTERHIRDAGLELVQKRFVYKDTMRILVAKCRPSTST